MKRVLCIAAMLALVAGVANAGTVLLSPTVNNGSFDDMPLDATNTTGVDIFGGDATGGYRAAKNSNGVMTIPGWTLDFRNGNTFGGVNYNASTPAYDGLQSVVVNDSPILDAKTDVIAVTLNTGDKLNWSAAMGLRNPSGTEKAAYNISLWIDGVYVGRLLETVFVDPTVDPLGYNFHSGQYEYTGAGATSVELGFTINVDGSLGGQVMADAFYLEVVPEPATMLILGLGSLFLRRKR